jgi:hypothetical protein
MAVSIVSAGVLAVSLAARQMTIALIWVRWS